MRSAGSSPRPWGTQVEPIGPAHHRRFIPTPVGNTVVLGHPLIESAVHPHARGEHRGIGFPFRAGFGSSPRPWGTQRDVNVSGVGRRFIPTPVGNTARRCPAARRCAVHPHARGEHGSRQVPVDLRLRFIPTPVGNTKTTAARQYSRAGSSPRPWGTRNRSVAPGVVRRFIPTPVGNTRRPIRSCAARPVHPHARGEHITVDHVSGCGAGSSPRPWGTRLAGPAASADERFIPTPVGNTSPRAPARISFSVHPHARGEHGTSVQHAIDVQRFIPTPVGNTGACRAPARPRAVHPHARGEHAKAGISRRTITGSSPRPWGTHAAVRRCCDWRRFIPTPVGNTGARCWPGPAGPVHPHARGEHSARAISRPSRCGSSPRPWGTQPRGQAIELLRRFIPTPVGNTGRARPVAASRAVHPHARGEHQPGIRSADDELRFIPTPVGNTRHTSQHGWPTSGSSPRPWGTRRQALHHVGRLRFIPTPVGNTRA